LFKKYAGTERKGWDLTLDFPDSLGSKVLFLLCYFIYYHQKPGFSVILLMKFSFLNSQITTFSSTFLSSIYVSVVLSIPRLYLFPGLNTIIKYAPNCLLFKKIKTKSGCEFNLVAECFPSMCEALGSTPSTATKK
jgi:hypothetical protein